MISISTKPWLDKGYELFGQVGPEGLKIEPLAKAVKISKSSFYHHFADLQVFEQELLQWHYSNAKRLVAEVQARKSIVPDFLNLLIEQKELIYFNRQLLIHKHKEAYILCFQQVNGLLQANFLGIWAQLIQLSDQLDIANEILHVVVQLFYQRLPPLDFDYNWILSFLKEVNTFLQAILKAKGIEFSMQLP
jgi:AcrR family transcriptional regulator